MTDIFETCDSFFFLIWHVKNHRAEKGMGQKYLTIIKKNLHWYNLKFLEKIARG